jgi:hemerythrin-like domain-containing protein
VSVSKAIDVLMTEHRLIERVLGFLESFALEVKGGLPLERRLVSEYGEFFGRFADACHHGKEEEILFRVMAENGFSTDSGPLAVMSTSTR